MTEPLKEAAAAYRAAENGLDNARAELHKQIRKALAGGTTQAEVTRITGYTRETIRRISKDRTT